MGKVYEKIDSDISKWIKKQNIFFVATAPLSENGHVNCSPKGGDTFHIIDQHTVAYLDYIGSGIETISHIKENKRILIMFCAFEGAPKIIRLHGKGQIILPSDKEYNSLIGNFSSHNGSRSIIKINVERISDSCGMGVPLMNFKSHRDDLKRWADTRSLEELAEYRSDKNTKSVDGLPGLDN